MTFKKLPPQQYIIESIYFDSDANVWKWCERPLHHFKTESMMNKWNMTYSNKPCGCNSSGYITIALYNNNYLLHRIVWVYYYGDYTEIDTLVIDHIDRDKQNNNINNLRLVSITVNAQNISTYKSNTSTHVGVSYHKRDKVWCAKLIRDGVHYTLGNFTSFDDAVAAYNNAKTALVHDDINIGIKKIKRYTIPSNLPTVSDILKLISYDPLSGIIIPKNNYKLSRWNDNTKHKKPICRILGTQILLNRMIVYIMTGEYPTCDIEHIDNNYQNLIYSNIKLLIYNTGKIRNYTKGQSLSEMSVEYLYECFIYDDISGNLYWNVRPRTHFLNDASYERFNKQKANTLIQNISKSGYMIVCINNREIPLHRLIYKMKHGNINDSLQIDHIDGNKLNNIINNLREVTAANNNKNKKIQKSNTTGFKGVTYRVLKSGIIKYHASITNGDKNKLLGSFNTPEEAHAAYCKAAVELHGEFANFG
jgi:hypothetical protein